MDLAYAQYQQLAFHRHRNTIRAQVHRWDDLGVDSMGYLFRKGRLIEEMFADIYEGKDWKFTGVTKKTRWDHQLFYRLRNFFLYKKEYIQDLCIIFTDTASGYYEWQTDSLPRLFFGIQEFPQAAYMVPYCLHEKPIVKDSLAFFFPDNRCQITKPKIFLQFKQAIFSQKPAPLGGHFDADLMTDYIRYVRTKLKQFPEEKPKRLFISRERAGVKRLLNECALYPLLEAYGFKVIHFETMPWIEQLKLCWNAEIILGAHGAGLVNIIYTKPQTPLIELISDLKAGSHYSNLSAVLKYPYFTLSSPFIPASDFDPKYPVHAKANFNVNPDALESLFKEIGLSIKIHG